MKKLQLNSTASDIFILLYLIAFLFFRFLIEDQFRGQYMISILFGVFTLILLYALIKHKFLNPNYFGLLKAPHQPLTRADKRRAAKNVKKSI